ncbi:MAG: hypothetical protein ACRDSH_17045 [Pseudonocardiaceae bacterium]
MDREDRVTGPVPAAPSNSTIGVTALNICIRAVQVVIWGIVVAFMLSLVFVF